MVMLLRDRSIERKIIRDRKLTGADRYDEVWNGVYVMSPLADVVHQQVSTKLTTAFDLATAEFEGTLVLAGVNVSDQPPEKWTKNYRCPDVAVYLPGNPARLMGAYMLGGPDFAVEVMSPNDRSRKKLGFYASVGVKELLLVDRKPWSLELFRANEGYLNSVCKIYPGQSRALDSLVIPVTFGLIPDDPRPRIEVILTRDGRRWLA